LRRQSIGVRLTLWYTAILSLGLLLFSCTIWFSLRYSLNRDLAASLQKQTQELEQYLQIEDQDPAFQILTEVDEYSRSLGQDYPLEIFDANGKSVYASPAAKELGLTFAGSEAGESLKLRGKRYLVRKNSIRLREGSFHLFLATSCAQVDRVVDLLGLLLIVTVPVFIVCAGAGGYWLSRKALLPVERITEKARTIGVHNLSERLPVPEANDELQRLTQTWNDMLQRLDEAVRKISDFTADASHELRTPVAIVRFAAENALRRPRSEADYRAALEQVQRTSEQMTALIEDLLFLARADSGAAALEHEPVALQDLIAEVCADLHSVAESKQIALARNVPATQVAVRGDAAALRRLILILLDNALKFTPDGGRVSIDLEQDFGRAMVRVTDSGVGIPDTLTRRIFERFFRVDPSRNRSSGGHGLGLAIAQTIAQQHGTSIVLEAGSIRGCVFSVSLQAL
jgi:heavy metal sensor kinase